MDENNIAKDLEEINDSLKPYYVYALIDKTNNGNKVFYVGKGTDERCDQHLKEAMFCEEHSSEKIEMIRRLLNKESSKFQAS